MSSTKALTATVNPELRLAQAVSEFRVDLTQEEKRQFRESTAPDVSDIMRFTAQFDRISSLHNRVYGPRLTSFLVGVHTFAVMRYIDIDETVRWAVWALVGILLQAVAKTKQKSFLEEITSFFMAIGRSTPQFENLNLDPLHSLSERLQTSLVEYYISVVRACHKIYKVSRSPVNILLLSKSTYTFRTELEQRILVIRHELFIQTMRAQKLSQESVRSLAMRNVVFDGKKATLLRTKLNHSCSRFDYQTPWKEIRKKGNTNVFLRTADYAAWRDGSLSSTMVYVGIPGAGKSVMLANIVDDLHLWTSPSDSTTLIGYFFCQCFLKDSLATSTIIGSLARQVLNALSNDDIASMQAMFSTGNLTFSKDQLCSIIQYALTKGFKIFFILDGLDECSNGTKTEVLARLQDLQDAGVFLLCIASRQKLKVKDGVYVLMPTADSDIAEYVDEELEQLLSAGDLVINDPDIVVQIKDSLTTQSNGMFLWAASQLSTLSYLKSDYAILKALKSPPMTIHETYARMLGVAAPIENRYLRLTLELILVSKRPLTINELAEALSIKPGKGRFKSLRFKNRTRSLIADCGGLVTIDEEDLTVNFIHSSVSHFLLSGEPAMLNYKDSSLSMIARILTYMNYDIEDTLPANAQRLEMRDIPETITPNKLASRLASFEIPKGTADISSAQPEMTGVVEDVSERSNYRAEVLHPFVSYVAAYWFDHLQDFQPEHELCASLLKETLLNQQLTWLIGRGAKTPLVRSVVWNHLSLFKILLQYGSVSARDRANALRVAEAEGREEILKEMIGSKLFDTTSRTCQLIFVADLIDSLADQIHEHCLEKVIKDLPQLLIRFAARLGYHKMGKRGQDAMVFILLARSNITASFQEQWLSRQQAKENIETPAVPWQDRVSLLGSRMGDGFLDFGVMPLPQNDEDSFALDELAYSETISQQSMADTHTTDGTRVTSLASAPSLSYLRTADLRKKRKNLLCFASDENPVISTNNAASLVGAESNTLPSSLSTQGQGKIDVDIDFILESSAYTWLVTKAKNSFHITNPQTNTFALLDQRLSECFSLMSDFGALSVEEDHSVVLNLGWDVWSFLDGFHFGDLEDSAQILGDYLTLTSDGDGVQALTCRQYLQQTWGDDTDAILSFIVDIVTAKYSSMALSNSRIEGWRMKNVMVIKATGSLPEIAEVFEQILWMGSSMRCGSIKDVLFRCFCKIGQGVQTSITFPDGSHVPEIYQISVTYSIEKATDTFTNTGLCWQNLFQYPVIAMNFPIAHRAAPILGLEMSLGTMISLSHSQHIGKFDDMVVIKGHSTMFTLTQRENGSCLWHVVNNLDGSFVSYSDIVNAGEFPHLSLHEIKQDRHFVGWCSQSSYGTGALDSNYLIRRSYADRIVGNSFFSERSLLRGIRSDGDSVCIAGDKHEPRYTRRASFRKDINQLHSNYIVLWDVEHEKGWLTNATSALLHLVFASLDNDARNALTATTRFDRNCLKSASQHTEKAAASILLNEDNLDLDMYPFGGVDGEKFQDRVADLYHLLYMMIDYQLIASRKRLLSSSQLEGWDFMDIADTSCALLYPRFYKLGANSNGWKTLLADIWAVTLFGRNFGEIFQPLNHATCSHWSQLPVRQSYLAASVRDLEQIMEKHGNPLKTPKKLSSNTAWSIPPSTFDGCKCNESNDHCTVVQHLTVLSGNTPHRNLESTSCDAPALGAVIFGNTTTHGSSQGLIPPSDRTHPTSSSIQQTQSQISAEVEPIFIPDTRKEISVLATTITQNSSSPIPALPPIPKSDSPPAPSSIPITLTSDDYLVAIICALPKELRAVLLLFDEMHEQIRFNSNDPYSYAFGKISEHNIVAACLPKGQYGNCSATAVGTQLLQSFSKVKFALLVGIGGGIPLNNDIRLGDVVVSSGYPGVVKYDFHKTIQGQPDKVLGGSFRPPRELTSLISQLEALGIEQSLQVHLETIATAEPEYAYPGRQCDVLYAAEFKHVGQGACVRCTGRVIRRSVRRSLQPRIHYGTIASGDQVMKDAKVRDRIGRLHHALCFEMEAGGLVFLKDCLVVRGICDYSDSHKHDIWQSYACASAAAYVKLLLSQLRRLAT